MGDWFERVALGALPSRAARRYGSREALVFEGRRWTFEEFDRDVDRAARGLLDPEELRDFCRGAIAGFKIPRRFFTASEFPMTASGKVQRFRLRAEAAERMREKEPPPPA